MGNIPNVNPKAVEKANCFGSAPLSKVKTNKQIFLRKRLPDHFDVIYAVSSRNYKSMLMPEVLADSL